MDELTQYIKKVLLENAIKYDGTTKANAAMGAVMREFPEYRGKAGDVMPIAKQLAQEINALNVEEQQNALQELGGSDAPEKEEKNLFDLDYENPVLRFEPSPSGPMHIGHAYPLGLNHLLATRNDGKLILRIADTNPDNIYEPAYKLLEDDAKWYTHDNISQVIIQSERMELYYTYAEKLIELEAAYVCTCEAEVARDNLRNKQACECREKNRVQNIERWELMKTSWEPGDAVLRLKTDITHKNPAMRDFPLMRINHSEHPLQERKYNVWPLMNMSVAVDDIELGMTHILRAKDHADNAKRQEYIYNYFDHPIPETFFVGKINFTDLKLSTSKTRRRIQEGEFTGWDDIKLPFLPALRRRGYQNEAFLKLADEVGISSTDKTLNKDEYFAALNAHNKEYVDQSASRGFFVRNPKKIRIHHAPSTQIEKPKHPSNPDLGMRTLNITDEVYVEEEDIAQPKETLYRLIDGFNFRYSEGKWEFVSTDYNDFKQAKKKRIIHYVPAQSAHKAKLHLPDGSWTEGVVEESLLEQPTGSIVQLERIGFARLDDADTQEYWYAHD